MTDLMALGYVGLFIGSFLAATIVPFSSEVIFTAMILGGFDPWKCIFVATVGNWFGGLSCYYIGTLGKIEWIEKYLHVKEEKLDKFVDRIHRHGDWFAFFSFLPGIGDAIAVASGYFRCKLWIVAVSMLMGKFLRYVAWLYFNGLFFKF